MSSKKPLTVKCPTCGKKLYWNELEKFKPFCSERCKLIDLGEWAMESHRIPGESELGESEDSNDSFFH